jgi:hypothetical protein
MRLSAIGTGPLVAGAAGALLLIFMFLTWFQVGSATIEVAPSVQDLGEGLDLERSGEEARQNIEEQGGDPTASAWQSFSVIDLVLLLAGLAGIAFAVAGAAGWRARLPAATSMAVAGLAALATLLIIYRIVDPPSIEFGGAFVDFTGISVEYETERTIGVFLGLIAALGIALGALLSMREDAEIAVTRTRTGGTAAG